jgi:hypothetical protein
MIKEKKYNALGRRCIFTKIRNPFKKGIFRLLPAGKKRGYLVYPFVKISYPQLVQDHFGHPVKSLPAITGNMGGEKDIVKSQ